MSVEDWFVGDLVRAVAGWYEGSEGVVETTHWESGGTDFVLVKFPTQECAKAVPRHFIELTEAGKSRRKVAEFIARLGEPTRIVVDQYGRNNMEWHENPDNIHNGWFISCVYVIGEDWLNFSFYSDFWDEYAYSLEHSACYP